MDHTLIQDVSQFLEKWKKDDFDQKKDRWIRDTGEDPSLFVYESDVHKVYLKLKKKYHRIRTDHREHQSLMHASNLKNKKELLNQLKDFVDGMEAIVLKGDYKKVFSRYDEIKSAWEAVGTLSRDEAYDVKRTYDFHVYRFKRILSDNNKWKEEFEGRNLAQKRALLDETKELCSLALKSKSESQHQIIKRQFRKLRKDWFEMGAVPFSKKKALHREYEEVMKIIKSALGDFQVFLKELYDKRMSEKAEIHRRLKQIENRKYDVSYAHAVLQKSSEEARRLMERFKAVGYVPLEEGEEDPWKLFIKTYRSFTKKRQSFQKEEHQVFEQNYHAKSELLAGVRSLMPSDNDPLSVWKRAEEQVKKMIRDFAKAGFVPKDKMQIQLEFDVAVKDFNEAMKGRLVEVSDKKAALIDELNSELQKEGGGSKEDLNRLLEVWKDLAFDENAEQEVKFWNLFQKKALRSGMDPSQAEDFIFRSRMDIYTQVGGQQWINDAQVKMKKEMKKLSQDHAQVKSKLQLFFPYAKDKKSPMFQDLGDQMGVLEQKIQCLKDRETAIRRYDKVASKL